MKNFVLGVIAGVLISICGYKPYQIEMEYRHNIAAGLGFQQPNHQPRFQPNGTYGAFNQTEVLGMFLGLLAFQLDHRIKSPTAHATTTNALSAVSRGETGANEQGSQSM